MSTRKKVYLIVRGDGNVRAISRYPSRLRMDEVAFPVEINFPSGWGQVQPQITVEVPPVPDATVRDDAPIWPAEEIVDT